MQLATACWPELSPGVDLAIFPLGSCEQHGPHLPFATDASVADAVASRVALELRARGVSCVSAPALPFGASGEHQQFPGTVSIGHAALLRVLVEIGRSASTWVDRLVFVNGHGGNLPTVIEAVKQLRYEGRDAAWVACAPRRADAHAGRTETSLMQALAPSTVRAAAATAGATEPLAALLPVLRERGVIGVSANGVLGDPTGWSAEEGDELLTDMVDAAVSAVLCWLPALNGELARTASVSA